MIDLRTLRIILACMALVLVGTILSFEFVSRLKLLVSKPGIEQEMVPDYIDPPAPCNNLT